MAQPTLIEAPPETAPESSKRPPAQKGSGERRRRLFGRQAPWIALTAVVVIAVLLPIIPLQSQAWLDGATGVQQMLGLSDLGSTLWNTAYLGVGAMLVAMVLGTLLALSIYSLKPRLQTALAIIPILPLMIPSVAHVAGFVFLLSPENGYVNTILRMLPMFADESNGPINVYTPFWIVIYTGLSLSSFAYMFVYSGLQSLGSDYGRAARVNGAGGFRVLVTVTLPMLRPTFVYAGIMTLLLGLGQFTAPLMLGRREGIDTLTTRIYESSIEYPINYGLTAALGIPLLIVAIFTIIVQRTSLSNQDRFVGQGAMSRDQASVGNTTSTIAATFVVLYGIVSALLPILALIYVALSPYWMGAITTEFLTLDTVTRGLSNPTLHSAITTTLVVTLVALAVVLLLGLLIALALFNKHRLWRPVSWLLDVAVSLPLAVPGALIGFGFLFAFTMPGIGIYGTWAALVIGFVTIMIPYSVRYQLTALIALGNQTTEASDVSGANPLRTFLRVIFPLAKGGFASAAAIIFILLSHEFAVALLLRAQGSTVLAVLLFDEYGGGSYPMVALIALVMTAITAVGVFVALLFGGTKALERM